MIRGRCPVQDEIYGLAGVRGNGRCDEGETSPAIFKRFNGALPFALTGWLSVF